MAEKTVAYIYVFTLHIGGKPIAKYAGRHSFNPVNNEIFDTAYLGSGTCWRDLRNEFGFNDGCKWHKKATNSFEFIGKHGAIFTGRAAYPINEVDLTDPLKANIIEAMVQSEGLNMDIINKFRVDKCELDAISARFIKEHKDILGGNGLFVNQRPGGTLQSRKLSNQERQNRLENSALQFMISSDKAKFINDDIGMGHKATFVHKDGSTHKHMLAHVYGASCTRLGYTFEELVNKMSAEEAKIYDESQKMLLIHDLSRKLAKEYNCSIDFAREALKEKTKDWNYAKFKAKKKELINQFSSFISSDSKC